MKYTVLVTESALAHAEEAYLWLADRTEMHAPTWYNGLIEAIKTLEEMPFRCPRVPEEERVSGEERQLLYGATPHTYRVIFIVRDNTVRVIEIIHSARDRRR